jgi:hypothetical protein
VLIGRSKEKLPKFIISNFNNFKFKDVLWRKTEVQV